MFLQAPSKMDNRQFELPPSSRTVFNRLQQSFTKLLLLRPCEVAFWAPQHTATSSYLLRPKTTKSILLVPGGAPQKCYKSRRHIYDTSIWDGTRFGTAVFHTHTPIYIYTLVKSKKYTYRCICSRVNDMSPILTGLG